MASLAAALVERQKVAALERAERAQRVRLVADPLVTVQDLQRVWDTTWISRSVQTFGL